MSPPRQESHVHLTDEPGVVDIPSGVKALFVTTTEFGVPAGGGGGPLLTVGLVALPPPHPVRIMAAMESDRARVNIAILFVERAVGSIMMGGGSGQVNRSQ